MNQITAKKGQELRKDIEEEVFKLGIDEVSNPVKVEKKYYVFKLDNIIPTKQLSLQEAQAHIYPFLFEKKMQEKLAEWIDGLRKQSYIKIIE